MNYLRRLLDRLRGPAFIGWGGDYTHPWMPCWTPDGIEIR